MKMPEETSVYNYAQNTSLTNNYCCAESIYDMPANRHLLDFKVAELPLKTGRLFFPVHIVP